MIEVWLFFTFVTIVILGEFYFFFTDIGVFRNFNATKFIPGIMSTLRDFREGRFYNPWSPKPLLIEREKSQMTELSDTPVLSQRAVYADMFGFKHSLNGLNHNDLKILRSRLFGRVLQVQGRKSLPQIYPYVQKKLISSLSEELRAGQAVGSGTTLVRLAGTCRRLASELMGVMFFGERLLSDATFADALRRHPQQVVACMAAFQLTPSFLSPLVHATITRRGKAMRRILDRLATVMRDSIEDWNEDFELKKLTILYHMIIHSEPNRDYWTPETLSQALLGVWFAASHQPWTNLDVMLLRLCESPEWQAILRQELIENKGLQDYETLDKLPLLDSFMRETARWTSIDKLAIRRKALVDYTFSSGSPVIPAGSTVCVSSYEASHNPKTYPNPDRFDGRRFVDGQSTDYTKRYADVSENYLIWGYGSLACPGRFHASLVIKTVIAHLLSEFDMRLEKENGWQLWSFESFCIPYESTRVVLTARTTTASS